MKLVYNFDGTSMPMWVQLLFWLLYMAVFVYTFRSVFFQYQLNQDYTDVSGLFVICYMQCFIASMTIISRTVIGFMVETLTFGVKKQFILLLFICAERFLLVIHMSFSV